MVMKIKFIVLVCLLSWTCHVYIPTFCPPSAISKVESHIVVVIGQFETGRGNFGFRQGAGATLKNNHIITAQHVVNEDNALLVQVWVRFKNLDRWVKADVIAQGHSFPEYDDYAILKMEENLGLPGLKISKKPLKLLQKVLFAGAPDGKAFFVRGGYVSMYRDYIEKDGDFVSLASRADFESPTVYVAYPGDSGGIITNTKGEIQSIMYFYRPGETYFHGNPVGEIWKFLKKNNLEWLGE